MFRAIKTLRVEPKLAGTDGERVDGLFRGGALVRVAFLDPEHTPVDSWRTHERVLDDGMADYPCGRFQCSR